MEAQKKECYIMNGCAVFCVQVTTKPNKPTMYPLKRFALVLCAGGLMTSCDEMPNKLPEDSHSQDDSAEVIASQQAELDALKDEKLALEEELRLQRERLDGIDSRLAEMDREPLPEPMPQPLPEPEPEPEPYVEEPAPEPTPPRAVVVEEETYPVVEDGLGMFYRDLAPLRCLVLYR